MIVSIVGNSTENQRTKSNDRAPIERMLFCNVDKNECVGLQSSVLGKIDEEVEPPESDVMELGKNDD
jgi:hypothetical protein